MTAPVNTLKFKFDISAYRLLGRELITDRITALFELVKNCYDANASNVDVEFFDVNRKSPYSKIIIKDDGMGMSYEDVERKWMVIGTNNKKKNRTTPPPFNRRVVGKKGVGRFAVDKLGSKLVLKTTQKNSDKLLCLETDWSLYEKIETNQMTLNDISSEKLFTDVENKYWFEPADKDEQGTTLEITYLNDIWTKLDVDRAYRQLSKLIRPNEDEKFGFHINITAPEYKINAKKVESEVVDYATLHLKLGYDKDKRLQQHFILKDGQIETEYIPERAFGLISMEIFYYDKTDKGRFKKQYKNDKIDGIKIYRDGVITTPFAESADSTDDGKDLLGIDKRRYSGFFEKISSRDILGWVDISDDRNPKIIDATNRQNFVDNQEWIELKKFIIEQICEIEKFNKLKNDREKDKTSSELKTAKTDLSDIVREFKNIKIPNATDEERKQLDGIHEKLKKTEIAVKRGFQELVDLNKEKKEQQNLFFSLVSLQTYAAMIAHITKTVLGRIARAAEFIEDHISQQESLDKCIFYASQIQSEMGKLSKAIDFMLRYSKDDTYIDDVNVYNSISKSFELYKDSDGISDIKWELNLDKDLSIKYNLKSFEDIIDNLITNSIKSLKKIDGEKIIKCTGITYKDRLELFFSDNGLGIPESDKFRIFDIFYTTTAMEGGAGLGLYIVKTRLESLNGKIEVVESEFSPNGITFKITIPFNLGE